MNVIPFPAPAARSDVPIDLSPLTPRVIAAILVIGEPATAAEIHRLLSERARSAPACAEAIQALLDGLRDPDLPGGPLFRCVPLGTGAGWAFTPALRQILRERGMAISLRPAI